MKQPEEHPFCNLKEVRKERKITQQQLADKIGVKSASIAMLENNKRGASVALVIRLIEALDCTFKDLYPSGKVVIRPSQQLEGGAQQLKLV